MNVSFQQEQAILAYWSARKNTAEIAALLGLPECAVAAVIPRILERRREARQDAARKTLRKAERRTGVTPIAGVDMLGLRKRA